MNARPLKLLLVDDERLARAELRRLLAPHVQRGAVDIVGEAASAADAVAQIGKLQPDLLLLDVQMPELDGFEVATMLKADPVTAAIPIIMVSAHEGRGARLIGLESGAEDYLSKPVDPAELIAKIRNLLLLRDRTIHSALH